MLILLILKIQEKNKKNQIYKKKKKVEGPIWRLEQTFTYKYRLKTQKMEGGSLCNFGRQHKGKTLKKKN